MTVSTSIDPARLLEEQLSQASPDLLRELLTSFINTLMSAEADAVCGAAYGVSSPERTNRRNGYRPRDFDTRTGTLELENPKLRTGTLPGAVAGATQAGRAGADVGGRDVRPARGLDPADGQPGPVAGDHRAQQVAVSEMAKDLDTQVEQFRTRRLDDAGPFTFVAADALVLKVREGGRVVPVHALVATGVNADATARCSGSRSPPVRKAPAGSASSAT